ncbi:hypothetical protein ACF3DV_30660 [Chlorogloeopsis fritschii PCC 9212]|uniref:Uncharacterized protein n=1 Tax=Chlorogloeopsis fritschii PCC 6912 TaxID=211165 RepID=A0A3S0ZV54_CHLFR|nr:hypothetical protein [Chlorogloeopsis fritschii]RUR84259.1 hypothetical protein PCC6912_18530 [Chlorogloeopsis fritschii PCC 6912]
MQATYVSPRRRYFVYIAPDFQSAGNMSSHEVFMTLQDVPNLWVPLALLGLIIIAAVFFSRSQ